MFSAFRRETGIKVNTVFAKKGLVERLQNEGANSPADLIFTVDIGRLSSAVNGDVTSALSNEVINANIPAKGRVEDGLIERYEDLAKPALAGRICTRSGKHSYMVALIASMMEHNGPEDTRAWLSGVKNNLARRPQGNDRAQVKAIAEGECDVAVINSYYMGAMQSDEEQSAWADSVNIVFPNQDDRGTHMNISGMSLTRSAPNRDNAIQLMEFLSENLAQQMYAEQNHEYPLNKAVKASGLVQSWGEFDYDPLPLAAIAKHIGAASKLVDEVGYDN